MKYFTVTGDRGFLGSAIRARLEAQGAKVYSYLHPQSEAVFLFGSPSSNYHFDRNPAFCFQQTVKDFTEAFEFCKLRNRKLIYPSSATVYSKATLYARCKATLEEIQRSDNTNTLGLRIFAGYGVGEAHKGHYASAVYQFCRDMKQGIAPIVFGDGTQSRDFVYIEDIVDEVFRLYEKDAIGIYDIGTGVSTDFNSLIKIINEELGSELKPQYVEKPMQYVEETICRHPMQYKVSLRAGIQKILSSL